LALTTSADSACNARDRWALSFKTPSCFPSFFILGIRRIYLAVELYIVARCDNFTDKELAKAITIFSPVTATISTILDSS